jgi:hypothetical protein
VDAEERESACGPLLLSRVAARVAVLGFSRQRCAEREGRIRRQSCSEGGQMDQQETLIVVFGGTFSASRGLSTSVYTVVEVEKTKMREGHCARRVGHSEWREAVREADSFQCRHL